MCTQELFGISVAGSLILSSALFSSFHKNVEQKAQNTIPYSKKKF